MSWLDAVPSPTFSPMGSGDSGAAGGPSSSAISMPANTSAAPSNARLPSLSRSKMYEVTEAKTGSSVKRMAASAGIGVLLCPKLERRKPWRWPARRKWQSPEAIRPANRSAPPANRLWRPSRWRATPEPRRRNLEHAERGNRVPSSVIPNQNNMHGVEGRGDECQEVTAIEMRKALGRNRKQIEAEDGGEYAAHTPKR